MSNLLQAARTLLLNQDKLSAKEKCTIGLVALGCLVLGLVPYGTSGYTTGAMRDAIVLAIFALSYDLIWGKAGTLTLGHAAFFGVGAYGIAIATTRFGWAPWEGLLVGLLAAMLVASLLGYFLLYAGVRLHFFAIITLAVLLIGRQIATSWQSVTGGDVGILGVPSLNVLGFDLSDEKSAYFFALFCLMATLLALWLGLRGVYGRVLAAVGMNEFRAKHCGFNTNRHLLLVFVASAGIAGFAGALFATMSGVVAPDLFSVLLSTEVILWVAVGGRGSLIGAVVVSIVLTRLQQEVSSYSADLWPLFLGVLFLFIVLVLPKGLPGLAKYWPRRMSRSADLSGKEVA